MIYLAGRALLVAVAAGCLVAACVPALLEIHLQGPVRSRSRAGRATHRSSRGARQVPNPVGLRAYS